ncbi:glycosyltransferase family 4 protein [Streptomyces sp. IBSBF 2953]|uniref:glycosyltransferase family 4 protein n=1 Tax=Streptomyces TaxID=1883 RepID=UPI00211A04F5|nr:glycosyltransferase family 4 protein [Streptomyces scabiei]MCQ9178599.1 glycosyltransferase family 4 protein [Streptomyces hayashii]MDX3113113.1 glycosyltransferase family 4 protein [Streptomyces scabiei]
MGSTLVITNDFPPRQGGIETFVHALATRMPNDDVVVYTSREPGDTAYDATLPFPVIRDTSRMLLPTKRVTRRAVEIARAHGCDRVWFGAAAPLGLMAPNLRKAGVRRLVATTHGHEIWWARIPVVRRMMRRIGENVDIVTYLGQYTRARIEPALGPRARMTRLAPAVDAKVYRPDPAARDELRTRLGLHGRRVILCVARLVPRKGQDMLIKAMPLIRREVPDAVLLLVGQGPDEARLHKLARRHAPDAVRFMGGMAHTETPRYYAAADVFAMPCRTRKAGLEAEGLGIVFLEAAASGLAVVVGDSGGAPDTVVDGTTGRVVDGNDAEAVAGALTDILSDSDRAADMGAAGRRWVEESWSWDASARRLTELLTPERAPVVTPGQE